MSYLCKNDTELVRIYIEKTYGTLTEIHMKFGYSLID